MWNSIFILINYFDKPYKKKDLRYLLSSRLINPQKKGLIEFHDIRIDDKCPACKGFQPWIILKNCGEGLFLLNKIVQKYEPWITLAIQEKVYDLNQNYDFNFDSIFLLINRINSRKKIYDITKKNSDLIINADVRIKNECFNCQELYPWIMIKNEERGIIFARELIENSTPFITLKKQRIIYKHHIPKVLEDLKRWTLKEEIEFGNLKIEISN